MKRVFNILLIFTLISFITSCSNDNDDEPLNSTVTSDSSVYNYNSTGNSTGSPIILRINKDLFETINSNRKNSINTGNVFVINDLKKEGDFLKVNLSYSGGCKSHNFEIIWDGIIYTDTPCFMNLLIIHNGNNDGCEAYITETIAINLKELVGDVEQKDTCGYNLFSSFNTSEIPDVFVEGTN